MCRLCVEHLCTAKPKLPPLALANWFFLGRHHPLFRDASLATRMLASSGRLVMRQLFLGRGNPEGCHKGMTGNTMLISQPAPTYDQVLPNNEGLSAGLVTLFCRSLEDVSKAQMLVVDREQFRVLVDHRKRVCPVFAAVIVNETEIARLPDNGVPKSVLDGAHEMPEVAGVKTTLHGPGNRISVCSRQEPLGSSSERDSDNDRIGEVPADAEPVDAEASLRPEELNEQEAIVGMDESACPPALQLFEAWQNSIELFNREADKFVKGGRRGNQSGICCRESETRRGDHSRSQRSSCQCQRQCDYTKSSCNIVHACQGRRGHDFHREAAEQIELWSQ